MEKGMLFCVCAEASDENCDNCEKYKEINPDITANCASWKKADKDDEAKTLLIEAQHRFRKYAMDVDGEATPEHKEFMKRLDIFLRT